MYTYIKIKRILTVITSNNADRNYPHYYTTITLSIDSILYSKYLPIKQIYASRIIIFTIRHYLRLSWSGTLVAFSTQTAELGCCLSKFKREKRRINDHRKSQTGKLISSCQAMRRLIKSRLTALIKDSSSVLAFFPRNENTRETFKINITIIEKS